MKEFKIKKSVYVGLIISFFIPFIGILLYLVHKKYKPVCWYYLISTLSGLLFGIAMHLFL